MRIRRGPRHCNRGRVAQRCHWARGSFAARRLGRRAIPVDPEARRPAAPQGTGGFHGSSSGSAARRRYRRVRRCPRATTSGVSRSGRGDRDRRRAAGRRRRGGVYRDLGGPDARARDHLARRRAALGSGRDRPALGERRRRHLVVHPRHRLDADAGDVGRGPPQLAVFRRLRLEPAARGWPRSGRGRARSVLRALRRRCDRRRRAARPRARRRRRRIRADRGRRRRLAPRRGAGDGGRRALGDGRRRGGAGRERTARQRRFLVAGRARERDGEPRRRQPPRRAPAPHHDLHRDPVCGRAADAAPLHRGRRDDRRAPVPPDGWRAAANSR